METPEEPINLQVAKAQHENYNTVVRSLIPNFYEVLEAKFICFFF